MVFTRASARDLVSRRELLAHEARHATQYAACLGLPFLVLYAVSALFSWALRGEPASLNLFERLAGLEDGGYRPGEEQRKDQLP